MGKALDVPPSEFIIGASKDGEENADDLTDDTQICSCHNVTKGNVVQSVKEGCKALGEVKSCTKAGTGCGGCMPLVTSIFNKTMKEMGNEVLNHICPHFPHSRADLYNIIYVRKLHDFGQVMREVGKDPNSLGCELCKPAIGSILAGMFNKHVMDKPLHGLQDTNDKYLKLPPVQEMDNVLGTSKWVVKSDEAANPFESLDKKLGLQKGLRPTRTVGAMPGTGNVAARTVRVNAQRRIDW